MRTTLGLAVVAIVGVVALLAGRSSQAGPARTLTIEGFVKDPAGVPVPGVWIARDGHKDSVGGTPTWRSDAHGRFRVDGLPEGRVVLRFMPGDMDIRVGQTVETTGGARDVVVVVEPGPSLVARIGDYAAPEGEPRWARLTWLEADGRRPTRYSPIRDDGWVRFVRLPKDRDLELWAYASNERYAHRGALRPGDEEVAVASPPGLEIRGKVLIPPGDSVNRVEITANAHPHFTVSRGRIEDDGTFVIRNLPEGTYRVSAWFSAGAVSAPIVQEISAGTKDVVFDLRR